MGLHATGFPNGRVTILIVTLAVCLAAASTVMADSDPFHLRIGFSSGAFVSVPREDIRIAVQVLSQKLARKTVGSAESRIYDASIEVENDLKAGRLDVVALTPEEFIHLRTHTALEPAMTTVSGKNHQVELLLLARRDSGLNGIADLKRRTIALPSRASQFGSTYHIWLETLVMKRGESSPERFFSSLRETRNASQAIMPVFFHKIDACVVSGQAFQVTSELNPQIARELKVIARINHLTGGIIALRQDLPEERKQRIRQALMTLHEDQEGRQMFVLFQLDRLTPYHPDHLKGLEALHGEHRSLRARMVKR